MFLSSHSFSDGILLSWIVKVSHSLFYRQSTFTTSSSSSSSLWSLVDKIDPSVSDSFVQWYPLSFILQDTERFWRLPINPVLIGWGTAFPVLFVAPCKLVPGGEWLCVSGLQDRHWLGSKESWAGSSIAHQDNKSGWGNDVLLVKMGKLAREAQTCGICLWSAPRWQGQTAQVWDSPFCS